MGKLEKLVENQSDQFEIVQTRSDDIAFLTTLLEQQEIQKASFIIIVGHTLTKQLPQNYGWILETDMVWATAAPGWAKWNWTPFMSILGSGAAGLVYLGRFDGKKYLSLMEKYEVNMSFWLTPTEYRILQKSIT